MTNTVYIQITDGKVENRTTLAKAIQALPTGRYEFKISRKSKRSLQQNAYIHAVCFPLILQGLRDLGWAEMRTVEQAKAYMKRKFLITSLVNEDTGEVIEYVKDTHDLTKEEMGNFIDDMARFCAEDLGFVMPMPNEQLTLI